MVEEHSGNIVEASPSSPLHNSAKVGENHSISQRFQAHQHMSGSSHAKSMAYLYTFAMST